MASNIDPKAIETRLLINGELREASDKGTFTLNSPFTRKPVCEVPEATEQDVDAAVAAAKAAQPAWAALSPGDRGKYFEKWGKLIEENLSTLAALEATSMGKPVTQYIDGQMALGRLKSCTELAWTIHGKTSLNEPRQLNLTLRQPFGVVAGIIPWNVPVLFFIWKAAAALATGNTVVIKSSEKAPLTSALLGKLSIDAGLPPGVLNVLSGHGTPSGACLAAHMDVRAISFTGSARTGRLIQQASAKSNLKSVILELGGKSPAVVCDDADLDRAVPDLAMSILFMSGQVCMASTRVYVQKSIKNKFIEKYKEILSSIKWGDPSDSATTHGPQADKIQYDNVNRLIESGKGSGAKLILGGATPSEDGGYFVEPTIFTDTPEDAKIMKDEIFGSVVSINTFDTDEEALRRANDTEYGLYASVYTKDLDRALKYARGLEAGNVGVNCTSPMGNASDLGFGGWKGSGQGREGIVDSLDHYLEHKTVVIKTG